MALIRLKGAYAREIAALGVDVEPGEPVDVPDDLAASLCEQVDVWERVEVAAPTKRSAKADDDPPAGEEE
jgi:hypothetical protein